jgi:D-xylose transport system ATP-binding protein
VRKTAGWQHVIHASRRDDGTLRDRALGLRRFAAWGNVCRPEPGDQRSLRGRVDGYEDGSMSDPILQLDTIVKNYGAIEVLRGISFDVGRGEVLALLGDNGAGKSTLVKIISGGVQPTSGRIVFDGAERQFASPAEAKAAGIETVYQDLSLCTNVDVVANFFMGREIVKRVFGIPILQERAMQAVVETAMANAGTRIPSLRTNVEHLSGGQRQAIELNRFIHWGGKLVLLDEPFAALGVEQTRRGLDMIKRIAAQGIGVVIITHIMAQAFQVADRMVVDQPIPAAARMRGA